MTNLPDPADDRDEPTDDEINESIDRCEPVCVLTDLMSLTTDKEILAWAHAFKQQIHDDIEINRENQESDGDE
jgi:hypothetical protein